MMTAGGTRRAPASAPTADGSAGGTVADTRPPLSSVLPSGLATRDQRYNSGAMGAARPATTHLAVLFRPSARPLPLRPPCGRPTQPW